MDNLMIGATPERQDSTTLTVGLRSSHVYLNVVTSWLVRSQVVSNRYLQQLALMCRPRLLLLDEPSTNLAPLIIEDLFERFTTLNKETGLTMLIVEQNANLALEMADYGYVIESGEISLGGSADQLKNDPAVQEAYLGA